MRTAMQVSKLDAARRQIDTAITLFFHERDPVSIHTLTAAGYEVLRDLNAKRGGSPMLVKEKLVDWVPEEHKAKVQKKLNEAENFFKHADRDPEKLLRFNPEASEFMLWDCCLKYHQLTGEVTPHMWAYRFWFSVKNPDFLRVPSETLALLGEASSTLSMTSKQEFLSAALVARNRFVD